MFAGRTICVVGAGASADANLPVGAKLKERISGLLHFRSVGEWPNERLEGDKVIWRTLENLCSSENSRDRLQGYLDTCGFISEAMPLAKSIDHFLHSNRGNDAVEMVGKLAIARAILAAENGSKLFVDNNGRQKRLDLGRLSGTWYIPFAELLCSCTLEELPERLERIQFIVFNYDRCIEQFLLWAFRIYFRLA